MTQSQLFLTLLLTAMLAIGGAKEIARGQYPLGALLLAIPACYWISVYFGA